MFKLYVDSSEFFNEKTNEFITIPAAELELEHSLVSLSKWESLWEKPFLVSEEKTTKETLSYIKMMNLTPNVPDIVFSALTSAHLSQINAFINAKHTATWFAKDQGRKSTGETLTAELLYYMMIALNIPFDPCEHWHLNRLITLIRVCNEKNQPKKMNRREAGARQRALNAQRKAQLNTSG